MTDFFGIGNAIRASVIMYQTSARRSGRSISLINSLKDGDRVVFTNEREAKRMERLAKERGVKLDYMIVDPAIPELMLNRGSSQGRTIFDHSWVEEYYLRAIERASEGIRELQDQTSGYGEPHLETKRRAEEIAKFQGYQVFE